MTPSQMRLKEHLPRTQTIKSLSKSLFKFPYAGLLTKWTIKRLMILRLKPKPMLGLGRLAKNSCKSLGCITTKIKGCLIKNQKVWVESKMTCKVRSIKQPRKKGNLPLSF